MRTDGHGATAHDARKADDLVYGFALHSQRREQRGNLRVATLAGHDLIKHGFGLGNAQAAAVNSLLDGFGDRHWQTN
jgi:hypothetical protein